MKFDLAPTPWKQSELYGRWSVVDARGEVVVDLDVSGERGKVLTDLIVSAVNSWVTQEVKS